MDLRHPAHLNLDMNHFSIMHITPNKRGFQSYNKRRFSFKGSYLDFIALKEIQIRFTTAPILNREGVTEGEREAE